MMVATNPRAMRNEKTKGGLRAVECGNVRGNREEKRGKGEVVRNAVVFVVLEKSAGNLSETFGPRNGKVGRSAESEVEHKIRGIPGTPAPRVEKYSTYVLRSAVPGGTPDPRSSENDKVDCWRRNRDAKRRGRKTDAEHCRHAREVVAKIVRLWVGDCCWFESIGTKSAAGIGPLVSSGSGKLSYKSNPSSPRDSGHSVA